MGALDYFEMPPGDSRNVEVDFTTAASRFGLNVASVDWAIENGASVTISGTPAISGNVSPGLLVASATQTGCTIVRVKGTLSDGQTITEYFRVGVTDPTC